MTKHITIYTRTTCAYCVNVKKFLDMKHQTYDVINLDDQPEELAEIMQKTGARTVPIVRVRDEAGNEDFTIGWNPGKLASAIA